MTETTTLVFTGSRDWTDTAAVEERIFGELAYAHLHGRTLNVHVGDCPTGLDRIVREYCERVKIDYKVHHAHWDSEGRAAGPKRNIRMVTEAKPDRVWAFILTGKPNRGTRHCANYAMRQGYPVIVVEG